MSIQVWTYIFVGLTFALYIGIAVASRTGTTKGFYVAGHGVPAFFNGMATGADWMSAASFISMAGLISFMGYDGVVYLLGWTGGYVLLALLLAPYLRKYGKYTVPDFVGDRYYSNAARVVAVVCAILISLTYVAGQMRGVGVVFSRFLDIPINWGIIIGVVIVYIYAALGGMRSITWTQVAQYCVLIIAYLIPAIAISMKLTGNPIPQLGFGSTLAEGQPNAGVYLLQALNDIHRELGLPDYTARKKSMQDIFAITLALMVGTAGLPHVLIRFYTVPTVRAARYSAFWALLFIAILYTTAPTVAAFARVNLIQTLNGKPYFEAPEWFTNWEKTDLIAWVDKNGDGRIDYRQGDAFAGKPVFAKEGGEDIRGQFGQLMVTNQLTDNDNELYIDRDIIVLANPEIARLPAWVVALVAAGGLAAALSTAAGLLLVISSSLAHDIGKRIVKPEMSEREELAWARAAAALAVGIAAYFGIQNFAYVAQVVAYAFGLAASSFFPILILGIFTKRTTKEGAIAGMITGMMFTLSYIVYFKTINKTAGAEDWLFGISPEGIGIIGMAVNFAVAIAVSSFTTPPPDEVQATVESIRYPLGSEK